MAYIRFGRMECRYDEKRGRHMGEALESMTGSKLPEIVRHELVRGADELDLVRSGLDDTVRQAYQEIREALDRNIHDLCTAAYVIAIKNTARSYIDIGV